MQGKASRVLEIPVNWYLDDFPPLAYVTGIQPGSKTRRRSSGAGRTSSTTATSGSKIACYAVAVHPQIIGQAHHIMFFERLIEYIASKDGVWFATCEEIADAWVDDEEDLRLMEIEDVRGVELAPVGSGFR